MTDGDITNKIRTFAILTPENPEGTDLSAEQNNKLLAQFKDHMKSGNVSYYSIGGRYTDIKEHSFILINVSLREATSYAKDYKQESFFFGEVKALNKENKERNTTSTITYYKSSDGGKTYSSKGSSNHISPLSKEEQDNYSRHGDFKFTIDDLFDEALLESLPTIVDNKRLERAISGEYTHPERDRYFSTRKGK